MTFKFNNTDIEDLYLIEPDPFIDHRGIFYRVYCENEFKEIDHKKSIVNINFSSTKKKGSIRGMHFQYPPRAEIKIVKCVKGRIFDVAVDVRKDSDTYLDWHGEVLSEDNYKMLYVPEGFAHGFQSLDDNVSIIYFVTEFYSPEYEGGVRYNDPRINIDWPLETTDISEKDKNQDLVENNFTPVEL